MQNDDGNNFLVLQEIVRGQPGVSKRAQITARGDGKVLSPEEQAECLLDQATDPSILGRTWVGWRSWL
jgi:DNA-dependent protein kinase catalytic subunit